jgi:hypothetical protein
MANAHPTILSLYSTNKIRKQLFCRYIDKRMEQALKVLPTSLKQKDEQIQLHQRKINQLSLERGEMIKMIEELTKFVNVETPTTTITTGEDPTKKTLNEQQSFSSTTSAGSMPEEDTKNHGQTKLNKKMKSQKMVQTNQAMLSNYNQQRRCM